MCFMHLSVSIVCVFVPHLGSFYVLFVFCAVSYALAPLKSERSLLEARGMHDFLFLYNGSHRV